MKKPFKPQKFQMTWLLWIFLTLSILFVGAFSLIPNRDSVSLMEETSFSFNEDWTLEGEDQKISLPITLPRVAEGKVTISKVIPDVFQNGAMSISFMSSLQAVQVQVGRTILYEYQQTAPQSMQMLPAPAWHLVRLRPEMVGQTLRITYSSPIAEYVGVLNEIQAGSKIANLSHFSGPRIGGLAVCFAIFILGVLLILIYLLLRKEMSEMRGFLYLGIFAMLVALWSACETRLLQLFTGNVSLLMVLTFLSLMLAPIPLLLFFREGFRGKLLRLYNGALWLFSGYFFLTLLLQGLGLFTFNHFFPTFLALMMLALFMIATTTLWRYFKEKSRDNKISAVSILFLGFFSILDFLRYFLDKLFMTSNSDSSTFTRFGILLFIFCMGYMTFQKMIGYYKGSMQAASYRELANTDALSGLYNRAYCARTCAELFDHCIGTSRPFSLILSDIDNFKLYNDNYGHQPGDAIIQAVAEILKTCADGPDEAVVRYGGEEFLIVLPGGDAARAQEIAQAVHASLTTAQLPHAHSSAAPYVTLSQGIYTRTPRPGNTLEDFVDCADKALYLAKAEGKNRYFHFDRKKFGTLRNDL